MKNKLTDLNDHLFAQLERLSVENLTSEQLEKEIRRTEGVVAVSQQIIHNADLVLKGAKLVADTGGALSRALPAVQSLVGSTPQPLIEGKAQ